MKKNEDEIAELFRSRLSQHEMPLKKDLWEDIESELSKPSSKRIYLAAFVALAAVFILLFACSAAVMLFVPKESMNNVAMKSSLPKTGKHPIVFKTVKEEVACVDQQVVDVVEPKLPTSAEDNHAKEMTISQTDSVSASKVESESAMLSKFYPESEKKRHILSDNMRTKKRWSVGVLASIEAQLHSPMTIGLSVGKQLTDKITLESGLRYSHLQSDNINSIGIPLKVNYDLINKQDIDFYLSAGVMVEKNLSTSSSLDIDKLECSLTSAVGLQYKIADNLSIFAESGVVYHLGNQTAISAIKYDNSLNLNIACGVKFVY